MEEKDLSKNWKLIVLGSFLAFFIAISANALFSMMHGSDKVWKDVCIFSLFAVFSIYLASVIQYMLENIKKIKNKKILEITKDMLYKKRSGN